MNPRIGIEITEKAIISREKFGFFKTTNNLEVVWKIFKLECSALVSFKKRTKPHTNKPINANKPKAPLQDVSLMIKAPTKGATTGTKPFSTEIRANARSLFFPGNTSLTIAMVTAIAAPAPIA